MENNAISLSIIIPAFNVELYLAECLDSIVNQSWKPFRVEIIIIEDGSADATLSIAKLYAERFQDITVISQVNQGLSSARNNGLSVATGDYIWFIDSDDWIEPNSIETLLSICFDFRPDVISIGRFRAKADALVKVQNQSKFKRMVISGDLCLSENCFEIPAQLYLFRREYLIDNQLFFAKGKLHEDKEFTPRAVFLAKAFYYSDEYVYYHRERSGSITNVINPKRCFDLIEIAQATIDFSERAVAYEPCKLVLNRHAFFSLTLATLLANDLNEQDVKKLVFNRVQSFTKLLKFVMLQDKPIYRFEAFLVLVSPRFFAFLFKLRNYL